MNNTLEPVSEPGWLLEKTGRMLARKYDIHVICRGTDCCTDGNTIYLPGLPDEIPDELFRAIRGHIDHESAHILAKSDFKGIRPFVEKYGQAAFQIYNALEDVRVERVMQGIYPGSTENLSNGYEYAVRQAPADADLLWQVAAALYAMGAGRDTSYFSAEALKIARLCRKEALTAAGCKTCFDIKKLAIICWKKIKELIPRKSPSDSTDLNKPDSINADKSGQSAPSVSTTGDNQTELASACSDITIPEPGYLPAGVLASLGAAISSDVSAYAVNNAKYRAYTTEFDTVVHAKEADSSMVEALKNSLKINSSAITQRFLQILQSRKFARWLGDKDQGKLNPRSLHRLCTNRGDNQPGSGNVFRQRIKSRRINTAISLLLDLSGSMHEKKLSLALQTAAIFATSLEKLNISTSITGFTTNDIPKELYDIYKDLKNNARDIIQGMRFAPLKLTVFKDFTEKFDLAKLASANRSNLTPLGDSLLYAARVLFSRKEERRIIFCLTDGRPCVGVLDESITFTHTRESIERIQKSGVEVVLIGIREESVRQLSPNHLVVNTLTELPKFCLDKLKVLLTRSSP